MDGFIWGLVIYFFRDFFFFVVEDGIVRLWDIVDKVGINNVGIKKL